MHHRSFCAPLPRNVKSWIRACLGLVNCRIYVLHCNRCDAYKMRVVFRCLSERLVFALALTGGLLYEENLPVPLKGRPHQPFLRG